MPDNPGKPKPKAPFSKPKTPFKPGGQARRNPETIDDVRDNRTKRDPLIDKSVVEVLPQDDGIVTAYKLGWEMFVSRATIPSICRVVGIDPDQFMVFVKVGVPGRPDCPGWSTKLANLHIELRTRNRRAAEMVSEAAITAIEESRDLSRAARRILLAIQQDLISIITGKPVGTRFEDIPGIENMNELIRVLRPIADFDETVAKMYVRLFGTFTNAYGVDVPRAAEAHALPASIKVEVDAAKSGGDGDMVTQLLPESQAWTDDEVEEYARTGNRPARAAH